MEGFDFQLWHLIVLFIAGFIGELYGTIVGGGGILIIGAMLGLGVPLQNAIAIGNAGDIGTELGVIKETRKDIKKNWKLIICISIPLFIGGIIGTYFLVHSSQDIIKNVMIFSIVFLLIYSVYSYFYPQKKKIHIKYAYVLLGFFLILTGIYSNSISIGEGVFSRMALIGLLGMTFISTIGVKTAAILPIRIYGLVVTFISGLIFLPYLLTLWVATFLAGIYGVRLAKKIPEKYLKIFLLCITVIYLMYLIFYI